MKLNFLIACLAALSLAGTSFGQLSQDFTGDFPPPPGPVPVLVSVNGGGDAPTVISGWSGNALQLTHDGQGGQNNAIAWNDVISGGYSNLNISFDIRADGEGANADGFGFALLNTAEYGADTSTPTPTWQPEEPNLTNSLGIGFDTFHNDGLDPLPGVNGALPNSVSLHYNGAILEQHTTDMLMDGGGVALPDNWLENGNPISMSVDIAPSGADSIVSVTMMDTVTGQSVNAFNNVTVPGMSAYDARIAFRGRTGGADSNNELDNIAYTRDGTMVVVDDFESYPVGGPIPGPEPQLPVLVGGSPYTSVQTGSNPGATLIQPDGLSGVQPGELQLTAEVGGQHNFIAFDKVSDATDQINLKFQLKGVDNGSDSADGVGVMILDTETHGDTGGISWGPAEDPNLADGFGIGFKTFQDDEIRINWDGGRVATITDLPVPIVAGVFHDVDVTLTKNGDGTHVVVNVKDGASGTEFTVFDDTIVGMKFDGGARVAFGGRTGGAADQYVIDNVTANFVPEPSSLSLIGLGLMALLQWRRRR